MMVYLIEITLKASTPSLIRTGEARRTYCHRWGELKKLEASAQTIVGSRVDSALCHQIVPSCYSSSPRMANH